MIPATGHSYENGKCTVCGAIDPDFKAAASSDVDRSSETGDSSNMLLLMMLLFISGAVFSAVMWNRRQMNR